MQFLVGTSGYSYKEWKGSFYPEKLPQKEMLSYYARRFSTVELNNTFRRMPSESDFKSWASQVPKTFRFALKAPQTITHFKRLKSAEEPTSLLLRTTAVLGPGLGPVLFQLPPNFKKDVPRLEAFLNLLGRRAKAAFEFRHESWFSDDVLDCLRANHCALCIAHSDEFPSPEVVGTASWGYVRLRRKHYTKKQLADWIKRLRSQTWRKAYVFFKHEDTAAGPKFAARFLELAATDR